MFLYAVLGWLVASALMTDRPPLWLRTWIVTVAAIALFGAADEWHQAFVPGRSSDLRDLVADVSGAAMGASAAIVLLRRNQST